MMKNLFVFAALAFGVAACVADETNDEVYARGEITCVAWPCCGDGVCDGGETNDTCSRDCPIVCIAWPCCGDGVCDGGETCATCRTDCACPPGSACAVSADSVGDPDVGAVCVPASDPAR